MSATKDAIVSALEVKEIAESSAMENYEDFIKILTEELYCLYKVSHEKTNTAENTMFDKAKEVLNDGVTVCAEAGKHSTLVGMAMGGIKGVAKAKLDDKEIKCAREFFSLIQDIRDDDNKIKERMKFIAERIAFLFQHYIFILDNSKGKGVEAFVKFFVHAISMGTRINLNLAQMRQGQINVNDIIESSVASAIKATNPCYKDALWKAFKVDLMGKSVKVKHIVFRTLRLDYKNNIYYCPTNKKKPLRLELPPVYTMKPGRPTGYKKFIPNNKSQLEELTKCQIVDLKILESSSAAISCTLTQPWSLKNIIRISAWTASELQENELRTAASQGNLATIEKLALLEHVNINGRGTMEKPLSDRTPLMLSARYTKPQVVKSLLHFIKVSVPKDKFSLHINLQNHHGNTAYDYAAQALEKQFENLKVMISSKKPCEWGALTQQITLCEEASNIITVFKELGITLHLLSRNKAIPFSNLDKMMLEVVKRIEEGKAILSKMGSQTENAKFQENAKSQENGAHPKQLVEPVLFSRGRGYAISKSEPKSEKRPVLRKKYRNSNQAQ